MEKCVERRDSSKWLVQFLLAGKILSLKQHKMTTCLPVVLRSGWMQNEFQRPRNGPRTNKQGRVYQLLARRSGRPAARSSMKLTIYCYECRAVAIVHFVVVRGYSPNC